MRKILKETSYRAPLQTTMATILLLLSGLACTFAPKHSAASAQQTRRTVVKPGASLQKAIDNAKPGDTIVLQAGTVYKGPLVLPNKPGSQWITIQTSALESGLPQTGKRVNPTDEGAMPKIVTDVKGEPALKTRAGAHHYRFIGIEFAPASAAVVLSNLISLGEDESRQTSIDQVPHHIAFERCYIHAWPGTALKRGITLNSAHTDIIDSYLSEFKAKGQDAQAICGWNGPGPFRLINNYLEGSGENVLFGGANPGIQGLVPSDIEVRGNHFAKPLAWRGVWTVKNLFELKFARRVVVDGNLFENNWVDGQTGIAILFKVANPGRAPWVATEDVEFTNNVVRHAGGGVSILGHDYRDASDGVRRLRIANNLFEDIGGGWGAGRFLTITEGPDSVVFDHNTILHTGPLIISSSKKPNTNFVWTSNIAAHNKYGIRGGGAKSGSETLARDFPGAVFENNIIAGAKKSLYPEGNYYPPSLSEVSFVDASAGNYSLSAASPFKQKGQKRDPGCDYEALQSALQSVTSSAKQAKQ